MSPVANTRSLADDALVAFRTILKERAIFAWDASALTEADTRSKLIDPLFKKVLGWGEAEIRREEPVAQGYIDYVLGSDYSHLLVEAKRTKPRFNLVVTGKPRRLRLDGPHLLGNKKMRDHVNQTQSYANSLGVSACVLTNGTQFIVFKPHLGGRAWSKGDAFVWHDLKDIEQHFAEFYQLLAREQVVSGAIIEAFDTAGREAKPRYVPLASVPDADIELMRNPLGARMAGILGPLLTDAGNDETVEQEILSECYVTTPLSDQVDKSLNALLGDGLSKGLVDSGVVDLRIGQEGKTAFSHRVQADVKAGKIGTYILTGGVGSGKTTFLRRFAKVADREFVERYTLWLHLDFLTFGNVNPDKVDEEIREFTYRGIRYLLQSRFKHLLAPTGEEVRSLFAAEIEQARATLLYGLPEGSADQTQRVNELVDRLWQDNAAMVRAALRQQRKSGLRVTVVLDNTDQLGEDFQAKVFLFAQSLSKDFEAVSIVALREEKFFAAYRRGIFDAFGERRFHIGAPELAIVLRKRLELGRRKFAKAASEDGSGLSLRDAERADALLRALIAATTERNQNIVRMLACVSNGDMRHALDMFRDFVSSGNTNIDKIVAIIGSNGTYSLPFHEFAKSAILGSRKYYKGAVSHVVNLFKPSDTLGASHLTACRLLARLAAAEGAASAHGEGFVQVTTILREFREAFGLADDVVHWGGELIGRDLLESEPPRVQSFDQAEAVRLSAAGAYYFRYLVRSFAYLDLVYLDTPLNAQDAAKKLASMAGVTDIASRFERVRAFLDYLEAKEREELVVSSGNGGVFKHSLIEGIRKKVEAEIRLIARKTNTTELDG